jgi:ribulose-5-phosphate 4-epimerase/fuculose-1-phosphate aldolase
MDARREVAIASRVLHSKGILDGFGHVSRRCPVRPDTFWMSQIMAPGLVQADDVLAHDLNGDLVLAGGQKTFVERFIHSEIYSAYPNVHAIVHSHAPSVVPFTVSRATTVRPICHICGFLRNVGAPFEIADHAGPGTDMLVRDQRLGKALAQHLGDGAIALMRGHGFTTTGASIAQAVFRAVYTSVNCQLQQAAIALGDPRYLSDEEAAACEQSTDPQVGRAWELWVEEAKMVALPNWPAEA